MQRIEDDFEGIVQPCLNSVAHGASTALGIHCVHYDGLGRRMNLVNESIGIRTRLSTLGHPRIPSPSSPSEGNGMDGAQLDGTIRIVSQPSRLRLHPVGSVGCVAGLAGTRGPSHSEPVFLKSLQMGKDGASERQSEGVGWLRSGWVRLR